MQKSTIFLASALLFGTTLFSSCKDDKEDVAPKTATKTELLTAKKWRITALTYKEGNSPVEDVYKQIDACSKDDFYKFNPDKTFVLDEGATRCSANDPQTSVSGWDITADGSILLLLEMKGSTSAELYNITELTDGKLRIGQTYTGNGSTEVTEVTFTAF